MTSNADLAALINACVVTLTKGSIYIKGSGTWALNNRVLVNGKDVSFYVEPIIQACAAFPDAQMFYFLNSHNTNFFFNTLDGNKANNGAAPRGSIVALQFYDCTNIVGSANFLNTIDDVSFYAAPAHYNRNIQLHINSIGAKYWSIYLEPQNDVISISGRIESPGEQAIYANGAELLYLDSLKMLGSTTSSMLDLRAGSVTRASNVDVESSGSHGIELAAGATLHVSSVVVNTTVGYGILNRGTIIGSGLAVKNAGATALLSRGGSDLVKISDFQISDTAAASYAVNSLADSSGQISLVHGIITGTLGIAQDKVAAPYPVITDVDLSGVTNVVARLVGSANIEDCNGYVTENSGTFSIALHSKTATVTHGLAYTPTASDIGITWTTVGGLLNCTSWSVTGITSTQFVVNLYDANGAAKGPSGTITGSWKSIKTP
jgi:hypothetical protein